MMYKRGKINRNIVCMPFSHTIYFSTVLLEPFLQFRKLFWTIGFSEQTSVYYK